MIEECYQQLNECQLPGTVSQLTKLLLAVLYSASAYSVLVPCTKQVLKTCLSSHVSGSQELKLMAKWWGASTGIATFGALTMPKTSNSSQNGPILKQFGCWD